MHLHWRGGQGKQENKRKNSQTHKAVRVLRSRATSSTLSMTTVTDIGPVAPAITLFGTHRPCHCRRQIWSFDQSQPPRETSKVTWRCWEKLGSRITTDPPLTNSTNVYWMKSATDQNYSTKTFQINTQMSLYILSGSNKYYCALQNSYNLAR